MQKVVKSVPVELQFPSPVPRFVPSKCLKKHLFFLKESHLFNHI